MSAIPPQTKDAILRGEIDFLNDTIKVILIDSNDWTYSGGDQALSDIPAGARVATSDPLSGKTVSAGVANAADITLTSVTGDEFEAIVVYKEGASEAASPILAYIDQDSTSSPFAIQPNGGAIEVKFSASPNGVFSIA